MAMLVKKIHDLRFYIKFNPLFFYLCHEIKIYLKNIK